MDMIMDVRKMRINRQMSRIFIVLPLDWLGVRFYQVTSVFCPHKASDALGIFGCDARGAAVFCRHQVELT